MPAIYGQQDYKGGQYRKNANEPPGSRAFQGAIVPKRQNQERWQRYDEVATAQDRTANPYARQKRIPKRQFGASHPRIYGKNDKPE